MIGLQGEEPDATFRRSLEELKLKQQRNAARWGLGSKECWNADLQRGIITFSRPGGTLLTAPVQLVGRHEPGESRWHWGWDHPPAQKAAAHAADLVRRFGEVYGLADLTTCDLPCSEEEAWRFTAIALHLSDGEGAYRGRTGDSFAYMIFGPVTAGRTN